MIFLQLFVTFFKIGLFGFGGGYAMLSLIQGEVVTKTHWLTTAQFTDIVAISQSTPGPIGINSATYVGYLSVVNAGYSTPMAILGSCLATLAVVLPSFLLVLLALKILNRYYTHPVVEFMFQVLRITVVGLLGGAVVVLLTAENFGSPSVDMWQYVTSIFLFVAAFVGTYVFKIHPIRMIVLCGIAGLVMYL
jgi:chromate transporter